MRHIFSVLLFMLSISVANAQVLLKQVPSDEGQYIVSFNTPDEVGKFAGKTPDQRRQAMVNLRKYIALHIENLKHDLADTDLKVIRELWLSQAAAIHLSPVFLNKLRSLSYVTEVNPDRKYIAKPQSVTLPSGETVGYDISRIDLSQLWADHYKGQGVVVAILDTGVDVTHKDLKNSWRGGTNSWFDAYEVWETPKDTGHGTAVASVIVGGNNYTGGYLGVAPNATWIAARIIDEQDKDLKSQESAIKSGLQWVLDPDGDPLTDDFPDIVQNSWASTNSPTLCDNPYSKELEAIYNTGIDIIFSVGNSDDSVSSRLSPAFDPHVISVGAVADDPGNTIMTTSGRGPNACYKDLVNTSKDVITPSLVAPGQSVRVAEAGGAITELDGTSFSAPMVAGALALLRSKYTAQDYLKYRQSLYESSLPLGSTSPNNSYGRGMVQASAAATWLGQQTLNVQLVQPEVRFSDAKLVGSETDNVIVATLIRSGDLSASASVDVVSQSGTAKEEVDFNEVRETVLFDTGESLKTVSVVMIDDQEAEGAENFTLKIVLSDASTRLTITDDETGSGTEEDVIGGASFGLLELFLLLTLSASRLVTRWG